ncbi:MAG: YqeG family HAD IIIA-type phosphatase [Eubacterium sp.]|nr:YqeG family HAD IIIA-type phosphatase [Eubacterium sp.]
MFEKYFPDVTVGSTYDIDFEKLYEDGYRGLLFDIDNTLVRHGEMADDRAKELFTRLRNIGFECCLISNNKKRRVSSFNEDIDVHTIFNAHKPAAKGYYYAMELMNTNLNNTVFIGDQLFTDIFGAKRIGMKNYLVSPINKREEIQIVIKRKLENVVLSEYHTKLKARIKELEETLEQRSHERAQIRELKAQGREEIRQQSRDARQQSRDARQQVRETRQRIREQIRAMKAQERVLRAREREDYRIRNGYHLLKRQ